jgi:uncharacterized protein (DUF1800 family)
MLEDPALLIWLDAPSNRKGKPNENLARELMELFTLGVGHYAEQDVKEAARALTGLTVAQGKIHVRADYHDDGEKTVLGKTARFNADTLADYLLDQPAVADRLAWRLCDTFLGEGVADARSRGELAERLRNDDLHVGRAVEKVLRSNLFFSKANLHAKVSDPVGFAIGSVRALEHFDPPPSTLLLAEWTARMGLELFAPPNVGGWPGGRRWLTGRAIVARANFAAALACGRLNWDAAPPNLQEVAIRRGRAQEPQESIGFFGQLLTGRRLDRVVAKDHWKRAAGAAGPETERLNRAVALLLARPESQVV